MALRPRNGGSAQTVKSKTCPDICGRQQNDWRRQRGQTSMTTVTAGRGGSRTREMTKEERKVIVASSLGTVFEWYDFYLAGSLAANFVPGANDTARFIFVLFGFAAGFAVRPFGALFFGRLGDLIGRKYTFLVTMTVMGIATFVVGLLPGYATIGILAPVGFIICRLLQGLRSEE